MTAQTFGYPEVNWEQQGSFIGPHNDILTEPDAAPLIQLPCINADWYGVLMGALDQLRNPSSWDPTLSEAARIGVLHRVDDLRDLFATALNVPCCNVQMRLQDCVLQFSTDGGSTWNDVTNWSSDFSGCVSNVVTPPAPEQPPGQSINQRACNIAGFLASEVIQKAMKLAHDDIVASVGDIQYANDIMASIGSFFPITFAAMTAFKDFYNALVAETLSEVASTSTDPVFWAAVTCAIYNATKSDGYVTAGNFAACVAAIGAISYTFAWAPGITAAVFNQLGLQNIRQLQHAGAVDDVDCTDCGTWCYEYDFRLNDYGWAVYPGVTGVSWVSGVGFVGTAGNISGDTRINIYKTFAGIVSCHQHNIKAGYNGTPFGGDFCMNGYTGGIGGTFINHWCTTPTANTGLIQAYPCVGCGNLSIDTVYQFIEVGGSAGNIIIQSIQLQGDGPNPFGLDNCTY